MAALWKRRMEKRRAKAMKTELISIGMRDRIGNQSHDGKGDFQ